MAIDNTLIYVRLFLRTNGGEAMRKISITAAAYLICLTKTVHADKNIGVGLGYDHVYSDKARVIDTFKPNIHLRAPKYTVLELGAEVGQSLVADLKFHFIRFSRFSLHLIDPGFYLPFHDLFFMRQDVERSFDFTFGGGVDVFLWRGLMVSLGARWMMPNPFQVVPDVKDGKYDANTISKDPTMGSGLPIGPPTLSQTPSEQVADQALERANFLKDIYLDSLRAVHLTVDLRWYW